MDGTRRRVYLGIGLAAAVLLLGVGIWAGLKAKRTADNVAEMVVPTRVLPTVAATAGPTAIVAPPTALPTPVPEPDGPVNILLLGADKRPEQLAGRTDAVILARVDPKQNRVALLSFPRDLWVTVPGYGEERINSAYFVGETKIGEGYGPELAKRTVSELTGLPVDRFVFINLQGFAAVIDKIGGIEINVPEPIDDPAYPTEDFGTIAIHFDAGCQVLDGERALQYARTRHQDNDFKRNQRQQQVLSAIFNTARRQGLFAQLTNLDEYTGLLKDDIRTDLTIPEMLSLAQVGARLQGENVKRYQIDSFKIYELQPPATFAVDPDDLKSVVAQFTGAAPDPPPAEVKGIPPSNAAAVECK